LLIYFHIDEVSRDTIVASALRDELKKIGGKLIYGNRMTLSFLRYFNIFDAVILPSILHYMAAFPDPDKLPDNIVILPSESVGQATGQLRRINAKYFGNNMETCTPWHQTVAQYLLWGFDHIRPFQEYYPSYLDKCKVVGHPRLADVCLGSARTKTSSKPVIGFVSRFSVLNDFYSRLNFTNINAGMKVKGVVQPMFENSGDRDIEDRIYTEVIDFRVLLQVMLALDPEMYTLSIRVHPRENRKNWSRFIKEQGIDAVVSKWDDPFSQWLNEVDIIVSPPSTSFYDMLSRDIHPICIRDVVLRRMNHVLTESDDYNQILDYVYCPKSFDEIIETIKSGKVPDMSEGVEGILEGQAGLSIAKNSISNIVAALVGLPKKTPPANAGLRCLLPLVIVAVVAVSYLKSWWNNIFRNGDQGSTFMFTLRRLKMINNLAKAVKG
jgi:hypothetical protein